MRQVALKPTTVFLVGLSMIALVSAANAQSEPVVTSNTLDAVDDSTEIVVTATRRAQSLQDVPMSIDVATGQQLQRLNIFDAKDVQQLSPGLQLQNTDGRSNRATLRGITFDPDQGTDPAVDLYFNEVPSDAQNTLTTLYDIEQIEILRGPQGALRGRTSPAGAITIRTKRPNMTKIEGYIQATGTEDNAYNVQGAWSAPLIEDKLAVRLAASVDGNRVNQVRNVNRDGEYSRSRTESVRASLAFNPTSDINLNLVYQYLQSDNRTNFHVFGPGNTPFDSTSACCATIRSGPAAEVDDYISVHDGLRRFQNRNHQVTFNGDWNMGPVTLSVVGGYQDALLTSRRDLDEANAIPGYSTTEGRNELAPTLIPYISKMAEVRLSSNNDGFWNWGISAYYHTNKTPTSQISVTENFNDREDAIPDVRRPPALTEVAVNSKTKAIAANSRFQFTDKLRLEVAARYTEIERVQTVVSGGFQALNRTKKSNPITGAANLTYEFNRDLTAYIAYGRAFRMGSNDVGVALRSVSFGALDPSLIGTNDEKSDSVEVGFKTALLDRRLSFNAAAFYQKFDGYISRIRDIPARFGLPAADPIRILDAMNANGDATIKGIEGTLAGKPIDAWDFSISASYVKARFDNANLPCRTNLPGTTTPTVIGTGNVSFCQTSRRLSDVPDFTLSANTEYRFSAGSLEPFVRALFTYRPSVYSEASDFKYPSQQMLNLYVGVRGEEGRWELSAFAKNVFDQNRVTFASPVQNAFQPSTNAGPFFSGYRLINATNPREFGLTGTFRF